MDRSPQRLSDDPASPGELRSAIGQARGDRPDPASARRIASKLGLDRGGTGGPAPGSRAPLAVGSALVVLVAAGALWWQARGRDHDGEIASSATDAPAIEAPTIEEPAADEPAADEPAADEPTIDAPAIGALSRDGSSAERPRPLAPAIERPAPVAATETAPAPASRATRPRARAGTALSETSEPEMLGRAHAMLARDPAAALRLAGEHERAYPAGAMIQEREVVAIDALTRLGRAADARARAQRFVARFPSSALRARVEAIAAGRER
jgi:hypothetical protein